MSPGRRRNQFKAWLRGFFYSVDEVELQDGGRPAGTGGFFQNAQQTAVHNSTMNHVNGNQYNTVYSEGDRNMIATQMIKLLSKHIIHGAAHDSSAREPPPRCHPETRVKLIARITAWFEGQASLELLLWITGPAGVGKSAVVQTFADYLVKSHRIGASVFLSRPNKRDNPHGVFTTIAYQLTKRVDGYRDYIVERLRLDPELLSGDLQAQFMTFIVEPFVEKRIGAGGKRWGILLDGLDELRGSDAQCEIIQLISSFAHEHPNAPLIWIIASRPESHISNTFEDDEVQRNCWSENIPIDSTEACADVERFLRTSFKTTQKKFRHCVSSDWPSNADFLKLTAAASGLFIYAQVVMQFIRDSHYADPVARFDALISVIQRSNAVPTKENPFVHLDVLYHEILSSIPSTVWPTTKKLLGVAIYGGQYGFKLSGYNLRPTFLTLRGMSILLGINRSTVYASLDKSRSTLKISDWKVAHKNPLTFLHASFSDYLKDSKRSGDFHVGSEEDVKKEVMFRLLEIWNKCCGDDIAISSVELAWQKYCSKLTDKSLSRAIEKFHTNLFHDTVFHLVRVVLDTSRKPKESPAYMSLRKLHMKRFCYFFTAEGSEVFVHNMMRISHEPCHIGFLRKVQLKDLKFGHLNWKDMSPAQTHIGKTSLKDMSPAQTHIGKSGFPAKIETIHRPRTSAELRTFVSDLKLFQEGSPECEVTIIGSVPKERVAVFESLSNEEFVYYIIPYPE